MAEADAFMGAMQSAIFLLPNGRRWRGAPDEGLTFDNSNTAIELSSLKFRPSSPCRYPKHFRRKCGVPAREKALDPLGLPPAAVGAHPPAPRGEEGRTGRPRSREGNRSLRSDFS
ncbi:hypothetical protein J3R73_004468 [Labrys monachus]|uniref:Uncharacterized protein n=1 Tax=Labrys monachus TaxID=217067 RepID=A0ABU0FJ91_9HYPH|nr:hypothetical protein [Labrys monachus]